MKKIVLTATATAFVVAALLILKATRKQNNPNAYKIGILQTASHPALDAARIGFMEELTLLLNDDVEWTIHNAQGTITQAHALAQQFHANGSYDAFFAIATPAAQALATVEKERPIIIAAVTDPASLGFVHPNTNICGVNDMIDVAGQIQMLTQLLPDAKTIGLLYTSGETNSLALVEKMEKELAKRGLRVQHFAVSSESDMQAMTESACRKVDVVLAPTDNTVASSISLISSIARDYKKPFIVSDNLLVQYGPLAAQGVNYEESGRQAARIAHQVIKENKKPADLRITMADSDQVVINEETLTLLGMNAPELTNQLTLVKDAQ